MDIALAASALCLLTPSSNTVGSGLAQEVELEETFPALEFLPCLFRCPHLGHTLGYLVL